MKRILLPLLFFSALLFAAEPMRTWTDAENRTIEARMLSGSAESVTVMMGDGRTHILPLDTLRAASHNLLKI